LIQNIMWTKFCVDMAKSRPPRRNSQTRGAIVTRVAL
jgi:hypothetical protein